MSSKNMMAQSVYTQFLKEDSVELKIQLSLDLWKYFTRNNIDSLKIVGIQVGAIDNVTDFGKGISCLILGSYYVRTGRYEYGTELLKKARISIVKRKDFQLLSEVDNTLGNALQLSGNYRLAAKYYTSSLMIGQVSSDESASFNGLIGLGKVFCSIENSVVGKKLISIYLSRALAMGKMEAAADAYDEVIHI